MSKVGNLNWLKQILPIPTRLTKFDVEVARLKLTRLGYVRSKQLKSWCDRNRNSVYVPEWLLKEWDMKVETDFGRAA